MTRINVIGSSGCGKSSLSVHLARNLGCQHVELDAMFWGPNWSRTPTEELQAHIELVSSADTWVVDGNYRSHVRKILWSRASHVVLLDLPLQVAILRIIRRSFRRWRNKEELWNGNRESLRNHFFVKDPLIPYTIRTFSRRRRENIADMSLPNYSHVEFVRLTSVLQVNEWRREFLNGIQSMTTEKTEDREG